MRRALLALALCACGKEDLTEVVVIIEGEPSVRTRSESLFLRVSTAPREGVGETVLENSNAPWTDGRYTLGLAPRDADDASRYVVEARALEAGAPIASARLISGFVHGQTRYVRLLLEDQCIGMLSCGEGTTCRGGSCVDAEVDPLEFAPRSDDAPTSSELQPAGFESDASVPSAEAMARDATTPEEVRDAGPDAAAAAQPDTGLASLPDAGPLANDAGSPPSDAGPAGGVLPKCKPGYYEGTWLGDYTYMDLGLVANTKIQPMSTVDAPVLSLLLTSEPGGLRISKGCVSSTMTEVPTGAKRPFLVRLGGSLDCVADVLRGGVLSGQYVSAGYPYTFTGTLAARVEGDSLRDGTWSAEEPASETSTGGGTGIWNASWKSSTAPAGLDPCEDVAAL
ncbi:MAG TPA: hypothetical protein VFX59_29465 [Polyangiales bacterium]|nr:hypothetical protein [Polyangiales bacterium]